MWDNGIREGHCTALAAESSESGWDRREGDEEIRRSVLGEGVFPIVVPIEQDYYLNM